DLSYNRAVVVGGIITSFTDEQKAYLAKMEFNNYLSWPDVAEDESIKKGLTDNEFVAVMTYASELFSWYKGNLDADVYFCPERHGTYFGGFYMKDYPAMNNPDYFISTEVTGDSGQGFLNALNTEQKALVIGIIEEQRAALTEIAQVRTTVSTELRKAISGGTIDKALVYSLIERYGELDGQMSALYASRFSAVKKTLTDAQMATLIELRNLDVVPLGAYRFSTPIAMPVISNTDFMFGVGDLPTNAGQTTAPESFGSTNMVSLTIAPTSPSTFGQTVTFTAKLNPTSATGTVVFWDSANGLNLSAAQIISGVATFTTSELSVGNHTFSATYSDNKSDAGSFSNSITYTVYALLVVSVGEDNGKGDTAGTFSYALLQSQALSSNTTISFTTKNVTFTSSLSLTIPAGVRIDGGSTCTQPPAVIINGNGANGDGLVLNGNNFLRNVWIKGFSNRQITTSTLTALWKKNTLQCVKLSR
ncbi:MAG: Ig-like domain repeat protein, partial [Chloroflexota bacterium]